ncbi:BTB and MATH domain-containing protein 38-like [Clytia hemisphaerica]|uniref:BTB domain-containing protein n=1 Tax=Clytia hemisphaerica TaxID=252671 RepID=A0A7M5XMZ4_9CNID
MSLSNENTQQFENALMKLIEKEDRKDRFAQPWKNSDVVLVVEDKELHVHSITLSMVSPVFEAMFNGNFKEAQTKRVVLEGKPYDTFLYMLRMVYPFEDIFLEDEILYCERCSDKIGQQKDYTKAQRFVTRMKVFFKSLQELYSLTNEYLIDTITKKINEELSRQSKQMYNSSHALHLLETAELIESEDLKTACLDYIKQYLRTTSDMKSLLEGRNISLKTQIKMKGQLFDYLVDRLAHSSNGNANNRLYKNELKQLGEEFLSLALKEEN